MNATKAMVGRGISVYKQISRGMQQIKQNNYTQDSEVVSIVNEKNEEIKGVCRKEMRDEGLIHRSSYIMVYNPRLK